MDHIIWSVAIIHLGSESISGPRISIVTKIKFHSTEFVHFFKSIMFLLKLVIKAVTYPNEVALVQSIDQMNQVPLLLSFHLWPIWSVWKTRRRHCVVIKTLCRANNRSIDHKTKSRERERDPLFFLHSTPFLLHTDIILNFIGKVFLEIISSSSKSSRRRRTERKKMFELLFSPSLKLIFRASVLVVVVTTEKASLKLRHVFTAKPRNRCSVNVTPQTLKRNLRRKKN